MSEHDQPHSVLVIEGDPALGNTLLHCLSGDFDTHLAENMVDAEALIGAHRYSMLLCDLFVVSGGPRPRAKAG